MVNIGDWLAKKKIPQRGRRGTIYMMVGDCLSWLETRNLSNADVKLETGSWVQVKPDEKLEIPAGVPIQNFSVEAGGSWRTPKHGFSPSINHQIHCLVSCSSGRRRVSKSLTFCHRDGSSTI
jgi:hypothetical protein